MRNLLGFLDKFRNRFWFNALALDGIIFSGLLGIIYLMFNLESGMGMAFAIILIVLFKIEFVVYYLIFTLFIFEEIFNKRITNKKFLDSKIIKTLQNIGIIGFLIPVLLVVFTIIYATFIVKPL
ncbi:TPA: hypothetical protein CPT84_02770 [Candidatus Gastranaerophilales bacterium HUM_12]|jgi:hypothetical protein|nr:unknown [Fusobacterium sp. CAG:815]DAB03281.1 MAG TPA: hypothetical protein CPT84_02770 [Candidatus Gastranaerophilales bacterium HUM_12]